MPRKRFPSWDPRGWPEAQLDPPTGPIPRVLGLDDPDSSTPLFDAVWRISGMSGRHARTPTGEVPVTGRHADDDLDGTANQADPDWRPDERDEHAHDDDACDQHQQQPERWVGVTRNPDWLPVAEDPHG